MKTSLELIADDIAYDLSHAYHITQRNVVFIEQHHIVVDKNYIIRAILYLKVIKQMTRLLDMFLIKHDMQSSINIILSDEQHRITIRTYFLQQGSVSSIAGIFANAYKYQQDISKHFGVKFDDDIEIKDIIPNEIIDRKHFGMEFAIKCTDDNLSMRDPIIDFSYIDFEQILSTKHFAQIISEISNFSKSIISVHAYAYVLVIEQILRLKVPRRAQAIRMIISEVLRIYDHLTVFNSACEIVQIECLQIPILLQTIEMFLSDIAKNSPFFRFSGVSQDLSAVNIACLGNILQQCATMVVKINRYLIHSSIFKSRTVHSGIINAQQVEQFCLTGINARASGSDYDVRQHFPYEFYNDVAFDIPIKNNGDCYDRFCLRLLEITESIKIIKQCLPLPDGDFHGDDVRYYPPDDIAGANIIYHLMYEHKGINVPATDRYFSIEAGNGEIGVYINTDGARIPYRIRIRSSVFPVVCLLPSIVKDVDELDIIITSLGLLKNR